MVQNFSQCTKQHFHKLGKGQIVCQYCKLCFCSNPELFTEHSNCVWWFFLQYCFFNTSGEKHLGRYCKTIPKDALILQFDASLPASGKEAKPKEFNEDSRGILIQCFVNAIWDNNMLCHLNQYFLVLLKRVWQYCMQRVEEAEVVFENFCIQGRVSSELLTGK